MNTKHPYLLAAYIILLGMLILIGWLFIGHADDAPGAGMIGIAACCLLWSLRTELRDQSTYLIDNAFSPNRVLSWRYRPQWGRSRRDRLRNNEAASATPRTWWNAAVGCHW